MGALQNIIYFAIFLGVLVTVHETGHFLAAKWAKVRVYKFSIGFGPKVLGFTRGETEYQIAALPLGGYVLMAGQYPDEPVAPEDEGRTFLDAVWWKRFIILSAGPAFNLIFPIFAYFFLLVGDHQVSAARVQRVEAGSPAAIGGLLPGDMIRKVDGRVIRSFKEISPALENVFDRPVPITVERDGKELVLTVSPLKVQDSNGVEKTQRGLLGVSTVPRPAMLGVPAGSPAEAAGLRTFDRVLTVNGAVVKDELQLERALDGASGTLELVVIRSARRDVGGATLMLPTLHTVRLEKAPGRGLASLGAESGDLYVWTVFAGSPAAKAGLQVGDRLLGVNGQPITSWNLFRTQLATFDRTPFELSWSSGGVAKQAQLAQVPDEVFDELKNKSEVNELGLRTRDEGELILAGPSPEFLTMHLGVLEAAEASLRTVPNAVRLTALAIGKLFTRDIPLEAVGGPIMLFQVASKSAEAGPEAFLNQMAMVSVNLGLVNLLPIPILDGFGLLAAAWEGIRRRPIPKNIRVVTNMIGFAILALLVVLVFKNDITKLLR